MNENENSLNAKNFLTLIEILLVVVTTVWVFAFMQADISRHNREIKKNIIRIDENQARLNEIDVNQAITQEQYRQIMEKIDEIGRKLDYKRQQTQE
jgi:competence protein ComGC